MKLKAKYYADLDGHIYSQYGKLKLRRRGAYLAFGKNGVATSVHKFIWEYFNGPVPAGMVINHINGNKHDNNLSNLEVVTVAQNRHHALDVLNISRKGIIKAGKDHWNYKHGNRIGINKFKRVA